LLTLRDSPDEQIWEAGIVTRTGRKWSATETVSQAESSLMHKDIVGVTAVGRQGIGATKASPDTVRSTERRGEQETGQIGRDGCAGSMDNMGNYGQEADLGKHLKV